MAGKQSMALIYGASFTAIMLIIVTIKGRLIDGGPATTLVCTVCVAACVLAIVGLELASRADKTWLPAFAALTTFKFLVFCAVCAAATLLIQDSFYFHDPPSSPPPRFILLLLAVPFIAASSLLSVLIFAVASLIMRLVPKLLKAPVSPQSKVKAVRAANITALSLGLILIFIVCKTG